MAVRGSGAAGGLAPPASFTIPGFVPPSTNRLLRSHWAVAHRIKKKAYKTVGLAALLAGVPRARGKRRVRIEVTIAGKHRVMDGDNTLKTVLDALVHCGMLCDDSPAGVEVAPVVVRPGAASGTTIILEDMEDGR